MHGAWRGISIGTNILEKNLAHHRSATKKIIQRFECYLIGEKQFFYGLTWSVSCFNVSKYDLQKSGGPWPPGILLTGPMMSGTTYSV